MKEMILERKMEEAAAMEEEAEREAMIRRMVQASIVSGIQCNTQCYFNLHKRETFIKKKV